MIDAFRMTSMDSVQEKCSNARSLQFSQNASEQKKKRNLEIQYLIDIRFSSNV